MYVYIYVYLYICILIYMYTYKFAYIYIYIIFNLLANYQVVSRMAVAPCIPTSSVRELQCSACFLILSSQAF